MAGQPWTTPAEYPLDCEANFSEVFRNAFMVNSFDGDEHLIIIRDEHILIFDRDMHALNSLNYKKDVHNALIQCYTCTPDFNCNGETWMMTFQVGATSVTNNDTNHIYQGNTMQNTWVMRWSFDGDRMTTAPRDMKRESILFKTEAIQGICEFAPDEFALFGRQEHIFIVKDWEVKRRINDQDIKNINKYSLNRFYGFDKDSFPFIVSGGESTFNLVNVKTGHMEVLVKAATSVLHAQTSVFFTTDQTDSVIYMHFATTNTTEENETQQCWYVMTFRPDFIDTLKKFGRLPIKHPNEALTLYTELQKLKERM